MERLEGLFAAPFTPLDQDGNLALSQVAALAKLYKKNNVKGAFICGTTGEGVSLSHKEKKLMIEAWSQHTGSLKVISMLGGTSIVEMKELARVSAEHKLDGISILCPYYFKPASVEKLVDLCQEIAAEAPDQAFYYYHIPALTGGNYSMLEFMRLAEAQIPSFAGLKYTNPNIMEFHACNRYKDGKYDILWGTDEALLSGLVIGAKGAVGSTYNYAAPLYNKIIAAFQNGNLKEAEDLQFKSVRMVEYLIKYGGTNAGKAFMKLIGVDCGWFRKPLEPISNENLDSMKSDLEEMGFFEFCSKA